MDVGTANDYSITAAGRYASFEHEGEWVTWQREGKQEATWYQRYVNRHHIEEPSLDSYICIEITFRSHQTLTHYGKVYPGKQYWYVDAHLTGLDFSRTQQSYRQSFSTYALAFEAAERWRVTVALPAMGATTLTANDLLILSVVCRGGTGEDQGHRTEGWLVSPEGGRYHKCQTCAGAIITEYREKLGEEWTFLPYSAVYDRDGIHLINREAEAGASK